MDFVKQFVKKIPQRNIRYHLHRHLAAYEAARSIKNLHASELTKPDFCPREYALLDEVKGVRKATFVPTANRVVYEYGKMIQKLVVGWYADIGLAVCDWKCAYCGVLHTFMKRPAKCTGCGCRYLLPEEPRFLSKVSGISCGIDVLLDLGEPRLLVVEIKSMDKEEFKGLAGPLAEHKHRTNLYMRVVAESGTEHPINTERAGVLYVSKGGFGCQDGEVISWGFPEKAFSPFKEFEVVRDDTKTQKETDRASMIYRYRTGEEPMPLGICPTSMTARAKYCPVVKECFSGKFPAGKMKGKPE